MGELKSMLETCLSELAKEAGGVGWKALEEDEGLHLEVNMPRIKNEDVQVSAEKGTLVIQGEEEEEDEGVQGEEEEEDEGAEEAGKSSRRTFGTQLDLPENQYQVDQFQAEMKDGILKIVVPKISD